MQPSSSDHSTSGDARPIVGRLAPSPTGNLHLGNLATLLFTWVQARADGGRLILRIEDLDPPRVVDGSERAIVDDLRWLGIDWDEGPDVGGVHAPYRQSERGSLYQNALERLYARGLVYPCDCSRRDIDEALSAPHARFEPGTRYPGTCRPDEPLALRHAMEDLVENPDPTNASPGPAWRMLAQGEIAVDDAIAGSLTHRLHETPGDFVLRRRDGLWAYQLAVVVDDIAMGVTDVVRGRDLFESTPRQFALYDALGADRPRVWHLPLVVDAQGRRLSKRTGSASRAQLEARGVDAARFRGICATAWGWIDEPEPLTSDGLLALWRPVTPALRAETMKLPMGDG